MKISKDQLRKEMRQKRDAISESERKEKSKAIKEKLFASAEFLSAKCIAFYISKESEVDTMEIIKDSMKQGKDVLVPVTNNEIQRSTNRSLAVRESEFSHIELVKFTSFEDLALAKFGVLEPKTKIKSEKEPDVIVIPGLAFDLDGHRLGYGKGHYDKFLKKSSAKRIGICFDFQLVERIPRHEHDQRLDLIISEKRVLRV